MKDRLTRMGRALFFSLALMSALVIGFAPVMLTACATPTDPSATAQDKAIAATKASYDALDQAILAATASVKAGVLKGQDARNTLQAMTTAKAGLDAALVALRAAAPPPSSASGAKP